MNLTSARKYIEMMYQGVCDVYEYQSVTDEDTCITSKGFVCVLEGQRCKISTTNINVANTSNGAPQRAMTVKLFVAPEVNIKPGSKVIVTQNGITTAYKSSGEPGRYTNHQEIQLELFDRWC